MAILSTSLFFQRELNKNEMFHRKKCLTNTKKLHNTRINLKIKTKQKNWEKTSKYFVQSEYDVLDDLLGKNND
jgi:hypothetical protein